MDGCDGLVLWQDGSRVWRKWRSGGERKRKSPGAIKSARVFGSRLWLHAPGAMRTNALESAERAILRAVGFSPQLLRYLQEMRWKNGLEARHMQLRIHGSLVIARPEQQTWNQARSIAQQRRAPCSVAPRCSGAVGDEILIRYEEALCTNTCGLPFVWIVGCKRTGALRRE
jgi:hypothetical protein